MADNKAGIPLISFASHNDATALYPVGTVVVEKATSKVFKYILVEDLDLEVGDVVEYSDVTGSEVTIDRAGGGSIGRVVAGVALGTIEDAKYGWIQCTGLNTYVKSGGSVGAGAALIPHASTNGIAAVAEAGSTAANTEGQIFGYSLVADTTSAIGAAMLRCAY